MLHDPSSPPPLFNEVQREYKDGADIAKAIKALSLPTLQVPGYPKAKAGETAIDPGDLYIWQQDIAAVKKQIVHRGEQEARVRARHRTVLARSLRKFGATVVAFVSEEALRYVTKEADVYFYKTSAQISNLVYRPGLVNIHDVAI